MSDLFGSKMADSLRKFADCEHKQLTCCGCGATATMTSWLMPYLHENDALRERVAELRTLLLRYGNHLPQCVFEPIIGRPEECNCGWKDIRDAADAAGGDGE